MSSEASQHKVSQHFSSTGHEACHCPFQTSEMRCLNLWGLTVFTLVSRTAAILNTTDTVTSSTIDEQSSSKNVGDFVAAGLGLTQTTTETPSSISTDLSQPTATAPPLSSASTNGSSSSDTPFANATMTGGNTVTLTSTSDFSSCKPTTADSRGQVHSDCEYGDVTVTNIFTNTTWAPATDVDECWTEWSSYWSMHKPSPASMTYTTFAVPEITETTPYIYTEGSDITDKTVTSVITSTAPTLADNGGFTQTMSKVVVTYTTVLTSFLSASTTITSMLTYTRTPLSLSYSWISASNDANWPAPGCTLPTIYPACQSQWDDYASHNVAPNPQPLSAE